jgi:copper(I)-binding protein
MCTTKYNSKLLLVCAIVQALAVMPSQAIAQSYDLGSIHIDRPWTRATPKGAQVAGGYMTITNRGPVADRLIGGSLAVANRFVIHEMMMDGDVMKMRPLDKGLELPPGATVELNGSLHLMFEGMKQPLQSGERIKGTLVFEKAGTIEIEYAVEGMGAKPPSGDADNAHSR